MPNAAEPHVGLHRSRPVDQHASGAAAGAGACRLERAWLGFCQLPKQRSASATGSLPEVAGHDQHGAAPDRNARAWNAAHRLGR